MLAQTVTARGIFRRLGGYTEGEGNDVVESGPASEEANRVRAKLFRTKNLEKLLIVAARHFPEMRVRCEENHVQSGLNRNRPRRGFVARTGGSLSWFSMTGCIAER